MIKKTIRIETGTNPPINLGVICCGRWFDIPLTGNIFRSKERLVHKLLSMQDEQISDIVEQILEARENA